MSARLMTPSASGNDQPATTAAAGPRKPEAARGVAALVAAITLLAGALRLARFDAVPPNPFYDAAVRSMEQSWHNLFFGAFDPTGALSIDKPPLDLWLQVASVQLFGFGSVSLRLPMAIAGTVAVPLLYDTVRRPFGRLAGVIAAAALTVLPVSVLTARSDTMDSVMMALIVLAAWLVVRALETRRDGWLTAAAVVLGAAFNVKLFEALIPLPAILVLVWIGRDRRLTGLRLPAAAFVATALSWTVAASLAPGSHPWPIGSVTGSVWDSVFLFNGADRLGATPRSDGLGGPGAARLFSGGAPGYGGLIGTELVAALALAALALGVARRAGSAVSATPLARAAAAGLGTWLLTGVVVFSAMGHLEARYLEAVTPAVAAVLGVGLAGLLTSAGARDRWVLAAGAPACVITAVAITGGPAWAAGVAIAASALLAAVIWAGHRSQLQASALVRPLAVLATLAVLALPTAAALAVVRAGASDAGHTAVLPAWQVERLSAFLTSHQGAARYEAAAFNSFSASNLIARDGRPVLVLTSYAGREFTSTAQLAAAVRRGDVRYALLYTGQCGRSGAQAAACAPVVRWARAHARDVSREAGLRTDGLLYDLTGAAGPSA